ncbi:DUF1768 domain-containing protein [bacterium]|nr:DUF1768 domain-containing protein [bacterium]
MQNQSQIRTYVMAECAVFRKTKERFGGLSNMAPGFPLHVNGAHILTSEALYQACRFPDRPDLQELIIRQRSPMTAKMKSKPHRKEHTRRDWDRVRVKIMRWCLRVKLAQNWNSFGALLQTTGDRPIVENSHKDRFWGAVPVDETTLEGRNTLGRLLMELREELRADAEHLRNVEPPPIPRFHLLREPIQTIRAHTDVRGIGREQPTRQTELPEKPMPKAQPPERTHSEGVMQTIAKPECHQADAEKTTIPKGCKRLAEVDFPIAEVSRHSVREKSIRHGHPSTLHLWWARRPLAACRAVLLELLLPDPCDPDCPDPFKGRARELLPAVQGRPGPSDLDLRRALLKFVADFANWDNSSHPKYLKVGRGLVKAAHPEETPLVVDPFAGGGSIPLEALRLGCDAFASDLNPVACLILKVMLEDIPRHGPELADELRRVGKEIKEKAEQELAEFYPKDPDGSTPIAYLWARTVRCESPDCGAEIPLMRSFWLCKKAKRMRALRPIIHHRDTENAEKRNESMCPRGDFPHIHFEIFEPKSESEVHAGTVSRAKATCLCCGMVLPPKRVRAQLSKQRGGADVVFHKRDIKTEERKADLISPWCRIGGARMLAVVTLKPVEKGRHYRQPTDRDYEAVWKAQQQLESILDEWERGDKKGLCPLPDEPLPPIGTLGFRVQRYGMITWGDLFAARQKVRLLQLQRQILKENGHALLLFLALLFGKVADGNNSLSRWMAGYEHPVGLFSRQAIPIVWDFCEQAIGCHTGAALVSATNSIARVIEFNAIPSPGQCQQEDARCSSIPQGSCRVWFTDPPYYDAIPYADLSDFFFVWLKRLISYNALMQSSHESDPKLTPKDREIVQDETKTFDGAPKDRSFFENSMKVVFSTGRRVLCDDGIGSIVFAHKTTSGWEALLSGLSKGGWTITASWPISTEMTSRLRARDSAALATSVHLICRPRPADAPVGDWADVLRELPSRVRDWIERLQSEGIRGADLVFACIGPALEIFSRYCRVETAEGQEVKLAEYLEKVWEVVGRMALEQILGTEESRVSNGAGSVLEEDARLTALFLWTLQSTGKEVTETQESTEREGGATEEGEEDADDASGRRGKAKGYSLVFDLVRRFAQPLGIGLPKWEDRIIKTEKGVVRLLPVSERARQLFGKDGVGQAADWIEAQPDKAAQLALFPELEDQAPKIRGRRKRAIVDPKGLEGDAMREATTLDRVHAAMLLQASGQANALRALIKAEQGRGPNFMRLANALSALYPRGSEEKRLLDAMLLAVPR